MLLDLFYFRTQFCFARVASGSTSAQLRVHAWKASK
jgi:hypothetical protein